MVDSSDIDSTLFTADQSTTFSHTLNSSQSQVTSKNLDVTRDELERKQFTHTIQLLKLELSQKQLLLETVRSEYGGQLEEMREELADTEHQKRLTSLKLQSMTHAYEEEVKALREKNGQLKGELEALPPTRELAVDVSDSLRAEIEQALTMASHLSRDEHQRLTSMTTTLPIPDLIKVRVYELVGSLEKKCVELGKQLASRGQEFQVQYHELQLSQQKEVEYREQVGDLQEQLSRVNLELSEIKLKIREGNYKIENFDSIKRERDSLIREMNELKLKVQEMEARDGASREELMKLNTEMTRSQQTGALHHQDNEYLSRQVGALTLRASEAEERAASLSIELEQTRRDKQTVYEQLVKSREDQRLEYEGRLQRELETLRARTALEMDQARSQLTEVMERDRRSLAEARDIALTERNTAQSRERETNKQYQDLLREHHQLQASGEGRLSELQARLQVAQFERERVAMSTEEITQQLSTVQLEKEKLQKKVDLLSQELWRCQSESETERHSLETRVEEQKRRLESYESVEKDLDDLVLQAAHSESESDAERVLFSYGFGVSLPTTSKRRLQQSVQLARRVLSLEKINASLRSEQDTKQETLSKLQEKVKGLESLLEQSKQPYCYLIETIRDKDRKINTLQERLARLDTELEGLKKDRHKLISTKNQMALDLEKLLCHNEELQKMKQLLFHSTRPPLIVNTVTADQKHADNTQSLMPTLFTKPKKSRHKTDP